VVSLRFSLDKFSTTHDTSHPDSDNVIWSSFAASAASTSKPDRVQPNIQQGRASLGTAPQLFSRGLAALFSVFGFERPFSGVEAGRDSG
jgi:hypothetical protein